MYLSSRMIDAAFKGVAAKVSASQQLKHKITFATVDLSNSRELFHMVYRQRLLIEQLVVDEHPNGPMDLVFEGHRCR